VATHGARCVSRHPRPPCRRRDGRRRACGMAEGGGVSHLFCFGLGYSASALARRCAARGWRVTGTSRTSEGVAAIEAAGYRGILFDGTRPVDLPTLGKASHVLVSIP